MKPVGSTRPRWDRPLLLRAIGVVLAIVAIGAAAPPSEALSVARAQTIRSAPESAASHGLLFWIRCDEFVTLSDAELVAWRDRGVVGFVCVVGDLQGLGGSQRLTANHSSRLRGAAYAFQRELESSRVVSRARAVGMTSYLGFYAGKPTGDTPFADWFDDESWDHVVLPAVRNLAAAAKTLGFAGVAVDQELYPSMPQEMTWEWTYPHNVHSQGEVRAKVKERGAQLMRELVAAFPGLEIVAHATLLPEGWMAFAETKRTGNPTPFVDDVRLDLWNGITSVRGYSAIRWLDSTFYKTTRVQGASWEAALQYNANRIYSLLSQRLSGWNYASSRLYLAPFIWIDGGSDADEQALSPAETESQLATFAQWSAGGVFGGFFYGSLRAFDYEVYAEAFRAATFNVSEAMPPKLWITMPTSSPVFRAQAIRVTLRGRATDDLAIRAVRWRDGKGHTGSARLRWIYSGNYQQGWDWYMEWETDPIPIARGTTVFVVEAVDINGLRSQTRLSVTRPWRPGRSPRH